MHQSTEPSRQSRFLLWLALALWVCSLALSAFTTGGHSGTYYGWVVLAEGLPFGWFTGGWAVYANIWFAVAAIILLSGRQPRYSVAVMLLLAATLPFFSWLTIPEGVDSRVMAWGWGMPIWIGALITITGAAIARSGRPRIAAVIVVAAFVVGFTSIIATRHSQLQTANEQERSEFLSHGMAFAVSDFCGVPLTWPVNQAVPEGEIFATDIEESLNSGRSSHGATLDLPRFNRVVDKGTEWDTYSIGGWVGGALRVKVVEPARFLLTVDPNYRRCRDTDS